MFEQVIGLGDRLATLVDGLDPDTVSGPAAGELWSALDRVERLAGAGKKTLLARRLADTHVPDRSGVKTAAEELARRAGTTVGAARDAVDTSTRLPDLPHVDAAVRRGDLSAAQAAVVAAAAAADPRAELRLLELAGSASLPELREECARVKAAADPNPDATNQRLHRGRRLRRFTGPDGAWTMIATGTPQAGAAINTALGPIIDQVFAAARREGRREPYEAYAFDALLALVERATGVTDGRVGGAAVRTSDGGGEERAIDSDSDTAGGGPTEQAPATAGRPGFTPRYLALLRVDLEALRWGAVSGQELCEISGVGPIPVSVARGLLGHAVLKLVITRGVDVANVTHLGRGPTAAQRIALAWASPGCTVAGCPRTRVEYDHREPWARTRRTRLDELDPLCEHHHDLKTHHRWALVAGHGKRAMLPPEDPRHAQHQAGSTRSNGTRRRRTSTEMGEP
ncbi:MAG TPA: HNH endonuclease signature motif containing protein, partial [Jiangellaceae bacterium]|nr:HNH endonuclease signature motif containing protein [Jiangellaceae bacterium]